MADDWYDIKFLESATNVRQLLSNSTGRTPSASIAREIAVCIQQGRLFFEAAALAPIQIKPLQIYYGVVAFAQAVIVARSGRSLSTIARAHGLKDVTPLDTGVEELALRVEKSGTFQEFNDAIAPLGRILYFDNSMPKWHEKPFDEAAGLRNQRIAITDILARTPGVADKFAQTFGSAAKTIPIMLHFGTPYTGSCTLRIDDPVLFSDRASLVASIQEMRAAYPFLERWRFTKVAAYRRTICAVAAEEYLLRRINGVEEPVGEKSAAARSAMIDALTESLGNLHWKDFETLIDIIFSRSGWHRVSALGGSQRTVDLEIEQATTGEQAAVQVKSAASQRMLNEYIERVDQAERFDRFFFVCHSPKGELVPPEDRPDVHVWTGRKLAETVLRVGLLDWVLEKND